MLTRSIALLLLLCMTSCSFPQNKESTQTKKQLETGESAANVVNQAAIQPADLEITVGEKGQTQIQVKQPVAQQQKREADTQANETFSGEGTWQQSFKIPLGASIILLAIGLLLMLLVLSIVRRSSKTLNAAWSWTDDAVSRKVEMFRSWASAETNPDKVSAYKNAETELMHLLSQVRKD